MTTSTTGPDDDTGALALRAARAGEAAIAAVVAGGGVRTDFKSGGHDLVTTADKAAEAAIIEVIRSARPDDAILGEEGGAHPGTSGSRWLVDPLDGTANFVYGRADHAVSVGVLTDGVITAGAIIRVSDGRWAAASAGTATAGTIAQPSVNQHVPAAQALVSFGLPYDLGARQRVFGIIGGLIPQIRGVRIAGSAACDFLALAHGECDAFVGCGLAAWDTAAGQAIVAASGGIALQIPGPGFDILIAAAPPLARELAELIAVATPRVRLKSDPTKEGPPIDTAGEH
jgi:myo-inositol-1(or 4)-monophosphatase